MAERAEPTPYELWKLAGEDGEQYRKLLREHGHLVPLKPGEKREPLPCGWPDRRVDEAHGEALMDDLYRDWPGEPGVDTDG